MMNSILYLLLLVFTPVCAQLQGFNLQVTSTDETCSGNGTLSFNVSNTTPGATISYTVYKHPDLANPISISNSDFLGSLSSGTYKIIATQTLGQSTSTQEAQATIVQSLTGVDFSLSVANQACVNDAKIIVTVTGGAASLYEIISGPVTAPLQESNIFEGITPGQYVIRVFNECGDANVKTITVTANSTPPIVSDPVYSFSADSDCDTTTITNTITYGEGVAVSYPVTIKYTVTPLNGDPPIVVTKTFESGDTVELSVTETFPSGDGYTYSMEITDGCNSTFTKSGMSLNPELDIIFTPNIILPCGQHYFTLNTVNFVPPYTLEFVLKPEDFDPSAFNSQIPGPFDFNTLIFGSKEQAVPEGNYEVTVVDACGKTKSLEFVISDEEPEASAGGSSDGCLSNLGKIGVTVPDRKIVSAEILEAPDDYLLNHILPENVTNKINGSGQLVLINMPIGDYVIKVIDECGKEHKVDANIPVFEPKGFLPTAMTGCAENSGAIRVVSENGKLTEMAIISAPEEFQEAFPFDVSSFIDVNGVFYMEGFPPGDYTLSGKDACGMEADVQITINAGTPPGNAVIFTRLCGSYNLGLADSQTLNLSVPPTYWLQKNLDAANDIWGHPVTNIVYTEGTLPTTDNSISMNNGETLYGLEYEGKFRIIKHFESYVSPNNIKTCFGALDTFEYYDGVTVKSVYNISCYSAGAIYVDATGLAPLHYTISKKDGQPFALDNGNDNVFTGLEPGIYEFVVEDSCGYIGRIEVNIRLLPELTNANDPGDMLICIEETNGSFSAEFDLLTQNSEILDTQPADLYTITYHSTYEDADNGVNAIPTLHTNTANPQIIYARLIHNYIPLCHDIVAFNLRVSKYPVLKMVTDYILCDDETKKTLVADAGFNSYLWSTGETTQSITVNESGNYQVTVGNEFNGIICETTANVSVSISGPPESWDIKVEDWTAENNRVVINATGKGYYQFSLDDKTYQDSPIFEKLKPGIYTVYIKDKNDCGMVSQRIVLLNYPKFFTPNGDGINDKWRIEYSWLEPEALIYVYDRYGKLIYAFTPIDQGWDGNFNGEKLPSTDYWFVVKRKDGRIHKGHFSMMR